MNHNRSSSQIIHLNNVTIQQLNNKYTGLSKYMRTFLILYSVNSKYTLNVFANPNIHNENTQ